MIESVFLLLFTSVFVLALTYAPGYAGVRLLGGSRLLSLGGAPAISAALAGLGAILAPLLGLRWNVLTFTLCALVFLAACALLSHCGVRLPTTLLSAATHASAVLTSAAKEKTRTRQRWWWGTALAAGLVITIGPLLVAARTPTVILERYDTLFHLAALHRIRTVGDGSSLTLNSVANTSGAATMYPAAFHDLAALTPGIDITILLNGATLALSVVPWALGTALLARSMWPSLPWAPPVAALVALLIPANPLDLWIHLSPIPNLVGFAMLPGALAAVHALWIAQVSPQSPGTVTNKSTKAKISSAAASTCVIMMAGIGLGLLQPNVAVTALLLLAVLTAVTGYPHFSRRPFLMVIPILALTPIALLMFTPLGARVTGFTGGLQVPLWQALGEVGLGLLTVWPMALGVVLAFLWWPGLIRAGHHTGERWLAVAWIVLALLYLDAATDSPLGLSVLYFRGQDRIAVPLAMFSALLVVPGIRAWVRALSLNDRGTASVLWRGGAAVVILALALSTLASIPQRYDYASMNLAAEYNLRGRFLQPGEREAFAQIAPRLDPSLSVLASPYSGAAHMGAVYDFPVYFPVAGVAVSEEDRAVINAVQNADSSPESCALLRDHGVGYIYEESMLYQYDPTFAPLTRVGDNLGKVLFESNHSRLIQITCDAGT